MSTIGLDLETFNTADLKKVGGYRYAETVEVMLYLYCIDDGPVGVWDVTDSPFPPKELAVAIRHADQHTWYAHNSMFDRVMLSYWREGRYKIPIERWDDTMVIAYSLGFPGALDELGKILLPSEYRKLGEGKALVNLFCGPQATKNRLGRPCIPENGFWRATRVTHPEEWKRFVAYGVRDVVAMRELYKILPRWNWSKQERGLWHFDQMVQDRGFRVDLDLARAAVQAADVERADMEMTFATILRDPHIRPSQREKVMAAIKDRFGITISRTAKEVIEPMTRGDYPADLIEVLKIMLAYNKSSLSKFGTILDRVSSDGRLRGSIQHNGAARTRRGAGRGFQTQNLPSKGLPKRAVVTQFIDALKHGVDDLIFEDRSFLASAAIRGLVIPDE